MQTGVIADLRSDTVTRPTADMRQAMAHAEVGDDVFGDDPTVNLLQERVAELTGKQAALFVPSGSMGNQLCIRAQTEPGDEIIAHAYSHFYYYEAGAPGALSGCSTSLISTDTGFFTPQDVSSRIRPSDSHFPRSRLVVIENTHNRGGGVVWPIEDIRAVSEVARRFDLRMHLDGARLWNASTASGISVREYVSHFDTVSLCFSKGLGAPVGSIICGSKEIIARAHRFRKMLGGGMRQCGILAAGALFALDHHLDRLVEDHENARLFAEGVAGVDGLCVDLDSVQTNIVYFDVAPEVGTAAELQDSLEALGVRVLAIGPHRLRAVTHLDCPRTAVEQGLSIMKQQVSH